MARRRVQVLLVTLLLVAGGMPAILGAQALEATFADLKGEVQWSPVGSTQWAAASANTVLHSGDRVRTSGNSSARLAFFDGSTAALGATTGIRLDAVRQVDNESQVQVLQTAGVTQAQVQQAPDKTTSYHVDTPAALVSASTLASTCPWVRVDANRTTLVRNYSSVVPAPVAASPQAAAPPRRELRWVLGLVPGVMGPILQPLPEIVSSDSDSPLRGVRQDQELAPCPFGDVPVPEVGPGVGEPTAPTQTRPYAITVQNKAGQIGTARIPRGEESEIRLGQPPSPPAPIGTYAAPAAVQR